MGPIHNEFMDNVFFFQTASYIGIDNCMEQLERAKVNIAFSRISQHVSLVQGCAQG